jgi:hypothetical protein
VTFELGEVITRAWQITWKRKSLWWFGAFFGLIMSIIFPLMFTPMFLPFLMENRSMDMLLIFMVGFIVIFFGFMAIMYPVSAVVQTALTLGVLRADQDAEQISLSELIKNSLPFFWRILGVMTLYAIVVMLINLAFQAIISLVTIVTFGLGMLCMTPFMLLLYPVMFLSIVWMEQAINGIIIDKMEIMDAIKQGWYIIRNNLLPIVLVMVVVYFGVGMVSGFIMLPMMVPFMVFPLSFMEGEPNLMLISISLLCSLAFGPLFALINGWAMAFTKSAWVLTYMHLTRPVVNEPQLVLQETTT